jgi:hypothetical protein
MGLGHATALASCSLLAAALTFCPVSAADTLGDPCSDWMKISRDSATGLEMVCGPKTSPAGQLNWVAPRTMPGGVHVAGSPCPVEPHHVLARSTNDYVIWCVTGNHVYLPGGVTITNPPQPIWALYSP